MRSQRDSHRPGHWRKRHRIGPGDTVLLGNTDVCRDPWFYETVSEKMQKGKTPESKTEAQGMPTGRSEVRFMVSVTLKTKQQMSLFLSG